MKDKTTALILAVLLGPLGVDRFYLGYTGIGILKLLTSGCFGILWIIDIINIATGKLLPADGTPYADTVGEALQSQRSMTSADELMKYRDLADRGAITEAEYQEKKRQLLHNDSTGSASEPSPSRYSSPAYDESYPYAQPISATAWPGRSVQPVLYCTGGQLLNYKVHLGAGTTTVGRTAGCTVRYENGTPGVSGRHCAITWDGSRQEFIVQDLGSSYDTFLKNGLRLTASQPYRLPPGEILYLGDSKNSIRLETE